MKVTSKNSSPNSPSSPVPTINISSTPAQEKLDSLLKQESEFVFVTPISSPTFPKFPPSVHASTTSAQHQDIGTQKEDIPAYEHTTIDMPPSYQTSLKSTPNRKSAPQPLILKSTEPEEPWPITKKLFFIGFLFWPVWFAGMGFSVFGKDVKTRTWGRRCACNSLIVAIIFAYLIVAYIKTGGKLMD